LNRTGVGGWLLVFCLLLLVWQPISLALVASSIVDALPVRGLPLAAVLVVRLLVAALGIAAGLALLGRRGSAPALAIASLAASAATDIFVYSTPYFPHNRLPGDKEVILAVSLAYYAIWFIYLFRSKRVRNTYGQSEYGHP
jgi:Protein of unknown function (DUF2569)